MNKFKNYYTERGQSIKKYLSILIKVLMLHVLTAMDSNRLRIQLGVNRWNSLMWIIIF